MCREIFGKESYEWQGDDVVLHVAVNDQDLAPAEI